MPVTATVADFKARYPRPFPYGTDPLTSVVDGDITKALADARFWFSEDMWSTDEMLPAYLTLAAYCLAEDIKSGGGIGLSLGHENVGEGVVVSKSAGPFSVTMEYPDRWKQVPAFAPFLKNNFGIQYLHMAAPRLIGAGFVLAGWDDTGGLAVPPIPGVSGGSG